MVQMNVLHTSSGKYKGLRFSEMLVPSYKIIHVTARKKIVKVTKLIWREECMMVFAGVHFSTRRTRWSSASFRNVLIEMYGESFPRIFRPKWRLPLACSVSEIQLRERHCSSYQLPEARDCQ